LQLDVAGVAEVAALAALEQDPARERLQAGRGGLRRRELGRRDLEADAGVDEARLGRQAVVEQRVDVGPRPRGLGEARARVDRDGAERAVGHQGEGVPGLERHLREAPRRRAALGVAVPHEVVRATAALAR
jgi:hypothetical protein